MDAGGNPDAEYQIFNPDNTFLLDMIPVETSYTGELWQDGDHVAEIINRGDNTVEYNAYVEIN